MAKTRILLVDDEQDSIDFVTAVLEGEDVEFLTAHDGEAGMKMARAEKPDLIILDVQMPKKDGFTVFAELRHDEDLRNIPVIMLTGIWEKTGVGFSESIMGDLIGHTPDGYVEKPVEPAVLQATVNEVLAARE